MPQPYAVLPFVALLLIVARSEITSCFPERLWCAVITVPRSTTPDEGDFVVPLIFTPVTVPAFFVKPHPETVDEVI